MSLITEKKYTLKEDAKISESINKKTYDIDMIETQNQTNYYSYILKRVVCSFIIICAVLVTSYFKYTSQIKIKNILNEKLIKEIKFFPMMNLHYGMPMIFDFDDLTIELSADYGQFYLNPLWELNSDKNDNVEYVYVPDYEGGLIYLEKHYVMDKSTTIYWSPIIPSIPRMLNGEYDKEYLESIENTAYSDVINYKIFKGNKAVETGRIIIELGEQGYIFTVKKD
jgi:hypothetical protein